MSRVQQKAVACAFLAVLVAGLVVGVISCAPGEPTLIPKDVLFGNPEKAKARVSPDGAQMAYLAPVDGVLNVWVKTIGQSDDRPITHDTDRGVFLYFWGQDSKSMLYLQDAAGDENWLLYSVDLVTGDTRTLTPYQNVQVRVIDYNKHHPNTMLISMNQQDPRLHDAYRLMLDSGELTLAARNPGNILGWLPDFDMKIRAALAMTPEGETELLYRDDEDASWESVLTWGDEDNMVSSPLGFTKDGSALYLIDSRNANAGRLVRLDLGTKELEIIAEDPTYDVSDVMVNPDTWEIEAVAFNRARSEWVVLDDAVRADFDAMATLDHGDFSVTSYDNAYDTWSVAFTKDDGPVSFYSYDRNTKEGTFLFVHKPDLNDYTLAPMEPMSFTSRDGMTINGYITYPPGKGRRDLPLVLNVHGGPWARDTWGYNAEAQWMANRGYACLQVNFRGSTGYGKEFLNAGDREWGGKMQNDLVDAVNWAIDQGIADPQKLAIYGASYGGYAALAGATFTPDLFCCSVPMMGPSNLVTFLQTIPPYWTTMIEMMYKRVGDPRTEQEFLKSRSPLFKVDQVKIPMLIAQGANDVRVVKAESDQFVQAMRDKGLDVEYIVFEDEGHGFAKPENRLRFYGAAETFLAKYLGGREEAESSAQ
ncbi:MAG: S9 family peptidase [Candidatus Eisenbacteria bacterium]|nr:S9 family peptidase [Candidatus Eisenbacteria bacterium]